MKFLIDECLSPALAALAQRNGYDESSHIVWMKLAGYKDWQLRSVIFNGNWTFVTTNSEDFRGPRHNPGSSGIYAALDLHAGLICLNGPLDMARKLQLELFGRALGELATNDDLVNKVLEITADYDEVRILRYLLPKPG